ncbi:MAG TPA: LamG domain-containing protein [Anaerolineae bacterium]|nr:LamG domain-containing protein [Anaerolineae bacterium]
MGVYKSDPNLVALWSLDEASGVRYDFTANNNDLADNNTVGQNAVDYKEGVACADFESGSSESLSITDAAQTGLDIIGNISIVAWVKLESKTEERVIISKYETGSNQRCYKLRYGAVLHVVEFLLSSNGTASVTSVGATTFANDVWHHVAGVYDGAHVSIYVDGLLDSNGASNPLDYTGGIADKAADVFVGKQDGGSTYWDGLIDELAVFDRALSATEVLGIYESGIALIAPVVDYYRRRRTN